MSRPRPTSDEENTRAYEPRAVAPARALARPFVRRGLSRVEAATYLGISPSKFDELRKAHRIAPPKVLDSRLIFTVERLDEFLDSLPDENETRDEEWTASL